MYWKGNLVIWILVHMLLCFTDASNSTTKQNNSCSRSLGAYINGSLPNEAFSASSESKTFEASAGRLGFSNSAWIPRNFQPSHKSTADFLQIDFGIRLKITGVATQGLRSSLFFVKSYYLKFSNDGDLFDKFMHVKKWQLFEGNLDSNATSMQILPCPVVSRFIQFVPFDYTHGIALKVDVFGCRKFDEKDDSVKYLSISNITNNSAMLSWTQLSTDVQVFHVAFFPVGGSKSLFPHFLVKVNEFNGTNMLYTRKLSPLTSCTHYKVQLRAFYKVGCGLPSVFSATFSTPPSKPISPQKLIKDNSVPETLMLKWQNSKIGYNCSHLVSGYIIGYRVGYSRSLYRSVELPPATTAYNITNLMGWQEYEFKITTRNKYGDTDYSFRSSVDGKPPDDPPVITSLTSNAPGRFQVTWKNPPVDKLNGPISGYYVNYRLKTNPEVPWMQIGLSNMATSYLIYPTEKPLLPWRHYEVFVTIYNTKYQTSSEVKLVLVIGKGPLHAPVIELITSKEPNHLYAEWSLPPETTVTSYSFHYKVDGSDLYVSRVVAGNSTIVPGLKPWTVYVCKVELDSFGRRAMSKIRTVLVIGKAPGLSPQNPYSESTEETTVVLTWDAVPSNYLPTIFQGYQIWFSFANDSFQEVSEPRLETKHTIFNLTPDTNYKFKVAAVSNGIKGPFSDVVKLKTLTIQPPLPPSITSIVKYRDKIKINWVSGTMTRLPITLYIINLRDEAGVEKMISILHKVPPGELGINTVTRMIPVAAYTTYIITIKSCIQDSCSDLSKEDICTTLEDPPSKVGNLTERMVENGVLIQWSTPTHVRGVLRKYVVDVIVPQTDKVLFTETTDKQTNSFTFTQLPFFQRFIARVTPYTAFVGPSVNLSFTSPQGLPGPPTDVLAILLKDDIVTVRWKAPRNPNGVITRYKVVYSGSKEYDLTFSHKDSVEMTSSDDAHKVRIGSLFAGTLYTISVFAKTVIGCGEGSTPAYEINTPVKPPKPPAVPVVIPAKVSSNSIFLYLKPAEQLNGPIDSYHVIVEESAVDKRKRRSVLPDQLFGYEEAKIKGDKMYITAQINNNQVPSKFEVGDGVIYNGYMNQPLKPATNYLLHVRAISNTPNGQVNGAVVTLVLPRTKGLEKSPGFFTSNAIIIIVTVVIACIILVAVLIAFYLRSRRRRKRQDRMNPFELGLMAMKRKESENDATPDRPDSCTGVYPIHPDHPPISLSAFPKAVSKLHRNDNMGFKEEYKQLKIGKEFTWDDAHRPENKPKNRYANIVAYDHSRVILSPLEGQPGSDYINASYIDGFQKANHWIATQGPLSNTFSDFWRMVREMRSSVIVMLTNMHEKSRLKCHKYWPEDSGTFGDLLVTLVKREPFASYVIRTFRLERIREGSACDAQQVKQFHFTAWPDHGVPSSATDFILFRRRVCSSQSLASGPTIVHCSAGVGRTGAYIALDAMLDRIKHQPDVDVFNFVCSLRMRRIAMVQTEEQYIFVHDAIVEWISTGDIEIPVHQLSNSIKKLNMLEPETKLSGFERQWKVLNHTCPVPPYARVASENTMKNRFSTVLPSDNHRVLLLPIDDSEDSTYINAVYADGYRNKNAFILTQCPLPRTVADFWRMICEHGSSTVIMLNSLDEGDDYEKFWPEKGLCEFDMISVECVENTEANKEMLKLKPVYRLPPIDVAVTCFKVTDKRNPNIVLTVKLVRYIGWKETRVPSSCRSLIHILVRAQKWMSGPMTVMCSDGIGRSGVFVSVMYTLERLKYEQVVDVLLAIRRIRVQRTHAVKYMDQYRFIHVLVQEYLNAFEGSSQ